MIRQKLPTATSQLSQAERVHMLATAACGVLAVARELVLAERPVELAGIVDRVGLVCAQALDLPHEQGHTVASWLVDLRASVDALEQALLEVPPDGAANPPPTADRIRSDSTP
jgi:hypothetical protein